MVSRVLRGSMIAVGGAAIVGFGLGFAAGNEPEPAELPAARQLPAFLCTRLGSIDALMPARTRLEQSGTAVGVRCRAEVDEGSQPTYSFATLSVTVTTYPPKLGRTADDETRKVFDSRPGEPVTNRPYPTKIRRDKVRDVNWKIVVITQRADTLVQVEYDAAPVKGTAAERALLVLADRAIWESK